MTAQHYSTDQLVLRARNKDANPNLTSDQRQAAALELIADALVAILKKLDGK